MNITAAAVVVAAILLLCVIRGYCKGLVSVIFSVVGIVATLALVSVITPYVSDYLTEHTQFYSELESQSIETVTGLIEDGMTANAEDEQTVLDNTGWQLPEIAQNQIVENASSALYSLMESTGIYEVIGQNVAKMMFRIIVYVLCFIIVYVAIRLAYYMLDAVVSLPGIRVVNKGAGAIAGLIKGLLIVWILFLIVSAFSGKEWASTIITSIRQNEITEYLYDNNLLLYAILAFL